MENVSEKTNQPVVKEKLSPMIQAIQDSRFHKVHRIMANRQDLTDEQLGRIIRIMFQQEATIDKYTSPRDKALEKIGECFDFLPGGISNE